MRLNPHVLGLIAGTLIGTAGCASQAETTSGSTSLVAGSESANGSATSSENGDRAEPTPETVASTDDAETSPIVPTSQGGVVEEDYPVPCGRG